MSPEGRRQCGPVVRALVLRLYCIIVLYLEFSGAFFLAIIFRSLDFQLGIRTDEKLLGDKNMPISTV